MKLFKMAGHLKVTPLFTGTVDTISVENLIEEIDKCVIESSVRAYNIMTTRSSSYSDTDISSELSTCQRLLEYCTTVRPSQHSKVKMQI